MKDLIKEPASEDLERCVVEQMEADGDVDDFVRRGIDDIASKYAQLGAQWQKEQDYKDFERLKKSWFEEGKLEGKFEGLTDDEKYQQGFHDCKEQMMKDAIEGNVCGKVIDHINVRVEGYNALTPSNITHIPCERKNFPNFNIGDKVKVIIINE